MNLATISTECFIDKVCCFLEISETADIRAIDTYNCSYLVFANLFRDLGTRLTNMLFDRVPSTIPCVTTLLLFQVNVIPTLARRRNNLRAIDRLLIAGNEIIAIGLRRVRRVGGCALRWRRAAGWFGVLTRNNRLAIDYLLRSFRVRIEGILIIIFVFPIRNLANEPITDCE